MIVINREKAEEIVRYRLRQEREPILANLDIESIRTQESGGDISVIVDKKQALRDVTDKDLSSLSIEELASLDIESALAL